MLRLHRSVAALCAAIAFVTPVQAGGILKAKGSPEQAIQILDHRVAVSIVDGFARTEVSQAFFNPNAVDLEALYSFPIPKSASLAEMTILAGESRLEGEVVRAEEARRIYGEEREAGEDAGLARQDSYKTFEFFVARVPAQAEASFRFVYYQPLEIDTGVGRYVYPLEDGGTDDLAAAFWEKEETARRSFAFHLELSSCWPVEEVRMPGIEAAAKLQRIDEGRWLADVDVAGGRALTRDLVFYYRLEDGLPGRVELVPYRASTESSGTFMLVLTPGVDLAPLTNGADYVFVLDVSGSMAGKIHTLADGVVRTLQGLKVNDRFRLVIFNDSAREVVPWTQATPENVRQALGRLEGIGADGSTNLFEGLKLGLARLDADRATSLVLVTDAVANVGETNPQRFHELMKSHDLRIFGFLLGNSANWPLMRTIAEASGGSYESISNADDIVGQLLLAKQKVTHEALHDVKLSLKGGRTSDVTTIRSKVYHGDQLVLFGRYAEPGPIEIELRASITGQDQVYRTTAVLPAIDTDHPELERLWALDRIEEIQMLSDIGKMPPSEGQDAIAQLGVAYQLVTEQTSMLVLADQAFERRGIQRENRERVARENEAQSRRAGTSVRSYRVDAPAPAFPSSAPSTRSGGGAVDPATLLLALAGTGAALSSWRSRSRSAA
jgi:Ca-activated chloride channel homolog